MGLDLGDALSALGAGGLAYMGVKNKEKDEANAIATEERKLKFLDKLEQDKEARRIKAEQDKHDRDMADPDPGQTQIMDDGSGGMVKVMFSKGGKELSRMPANAYEIEQTQNARLKNKASLENTLAQTASMKANAGKTQLEAGQYIANEESERKLREAQINNYNNKDTENTADKKVSLGEVQSKLVEKFKDLGEEEGLSSSDMYEVAKIVTARVAQLKAEGKKVDVLSVMPEAIKAHAAQKAKTPNLKVNF